MPKPVTAVTSNAGTLLSTAVRRRVDIARTKGHPTPAGIPSYKLMHPQLSASTGHAQKKTCTSMCPKEPRRTQTRRSGCTHRPGVARSPSFSITTRYQALLLLEAAHVLVWTCTSPMLKDKYAHELFTGICKISFENCKIMVWWQAGHISHGFITSNEAEESANVLF